MAPQDIDETLILPEKRISKPNKNTLHAFALEAEKPQTASAAAKRAGDPITDEADVVPARKKKKKSRPNKMPDLELDELPALEPVSGVQRPQVASPAPPTSTTAVYPSTPNLVAEVTRRKRTKGPKYPFRHEYLGRPLKDCAADHPAFWGSDSLVWSFLSITNLHYKDDDDEVLESCHVTCGICIHAGKSHVKTWPKYNRLKSGGSSGNFITHFEGVHALFWENAKAKDQSKMNPDQQATKEKASGTLDGWAKAFNREGFLRVMGEWIVADMQPYTTVDSPFFRRMLGFLKPSLEEKCVHSTQMRAIIEQNFGVARAELNTMLKDIPRIPLASDGWAAKNRKDFLGLVGSWITSDWELVSTLLDFIPLTESHTGENMSKVLFKSLEDLEIKKKFMTHTGDNAGNVGTLTRSLVDRLHADGQWHLDADTSQIRCLSHIIHLAIMALLENMGVLKQGDPRQSAEEVEVVDFLTEVEAEALSAEIEVNQSEDEIEAEAVEDASLLESANICKRLRAIVKLVRSSAQRTAQYESCIKIANVDASKETNFAALPPLALILDVPTRWNSTFYMLQRAHRYRKAIDRLCQGAGGRQNIFAKYAILDEEWDVVKVIMDFLSFFRRQSEKMARAKHTTLSDSLATFVMLLRKIREFRTRAKHSPELLSGLRACEEKLQKWFDIASNQSVWYYIAVVLDPRYKMVLFETFPEEFSEEWLDRMRKEFIRMLKQDYDDAPTTPPSPATCYQPAMPPGDDSDDEIFIQVLAISSSSTSQQDESRAYTVEDELYAYLKLENYKPGSGNSGPLPWWKVNETNFPHLARCARDALAIPGSSVSVERVFSGGRDLLGIRRDSLSAEGMRMLMLYYSWLWMQERRR